VNFALHIHTFGVFADPRLIGELADEADRAGWDGVFVADHLLQSWRGAPQPIADPWVALGVIALSTRRVRLGPMVTPLPRRRPWQLAGETVTLDQLSGGRLVLGVGSGIGDEFPPFGEEGDLRRRASMLDEGLDVLTGLWRGEPFSYRGEHYRLSDVTFLPRPLQQPRIPLWVAGHWPHRRPFQRAARWDGVFVDGPGVDWMAGEIIRPDDLRAAVGYTLSHRASSEPFDVVIGGHTPADPRQAADRIGPYADLGVTWWVEAVMEGFGTADQMRERVRQGPPRP
jgi:alkanesulfonate monooxygenase SsuD/methylene tetrahydromethanopterin reductase-like flavin-dependent oxidoreductase (luciferase family)